MFLITSVSFGQHDRFTVYEVEAAEHAALIAAFDELGLDIDSPD